MMARAPGLCGLVPASSLAALQRSDRRPASTERLPETAKAPQSACVNHDTDVAA